MKLDKAVYLCEMTAAGSAIGAFAVVYLASFVRAGPLLTLLFAWIPAGLLAYLCAHAVRHAMFGLMQLGRHSQMAPALAGARPATLVDAHRERD